jgi:diacylglycerol kinase (ATP)
MVEPDNTPSEKKRIFAVMNPAAGFGDPLRAQRKLEAFCERLDWPYEVYESQEDEDLSVVVKAAVERGCDIVVAAGGDGTVSGVAGGLVYSTVPLVILPVGTGNLLAHDLGIPQDLNRAVELVAGKNNLQMLDAMEINGHYYVMNTGVGWSSLIIKHTDRQEKRRFGFLAYIKTAVWRLFGLQPHSFRLVVDGKKFRVRASEILIANGGLLGVQIPLEDVHIYPDDGKVDMFVIKARTLADYLELAWFLLLRKPRQATKMFYIQAADSIEIASENPLPAQADGEVIGETPVTIRVIPQAVRLLVPEKENIDLVNRIRNLVGLPLENVTLRPLRGTIQALRGPSGVLRDSSRVLREQREEIKRSERRAK